MVIPKYEYWIRRAWLWFALISLLIFSCICQADNTTAFQTLTDSYDVSRLIDPNEVIANLQTALTDCNEAYLTARIKYHMGILDFKAGKLQEAEERLGQLAKQPECPLLVQLSSLNMVGQICRMEGENKAALESFAQLCNILEKRYPDNQPIDNEPALLRLWYSALVARAEIFQTQQDNPQSITEYQRTVNLLSRKNISPQTKTIIPFICERMMQLYFQSGDVDKYLAVADQTVTDFPGYPRTPVIKFEVECIKFCKSNSLPVDFSKGPSNVPLQIINSTNKLSERDNLSRLAKTLARITAESQNSHWGILLQYHYAWLLDAMGENTRAIEIFANIIASDNDSTKQSQQDNKIMTIIRGYAGIQYAIMQAENGEYIEATKVLKDLPAYPEQSHLNTLADCVSRSTQNLKKMLYNLENKHE